MGYDAVVADIAGVRSDVYNLQGSVYDLYERVGRVASTETVQYHVNSIERRLDNLELQINTLREQLTRNLLEEIARRFRDYFDTVQDPVSDEEFYKDLQALLFV